MVRMYWTEPIYWLGKIFFSIIWLVYLVSLWQKWDGGIMWHITGIISLAFFISNIAWQLHEPSTVR